MIKIKASGPEAACLNETLQAARKADAGKLPPVAVYDFMA
jgi:hypothetical protein